MCALGHWLPTKVSGTLVIIMIIPAIFKRVKVGKQTIPTKEYSRKQYEKIGMKIFLPALTMGVMSLAFALLTKISALVGVVSQGFRAFPVHDGTALYAAAAAGRTGRRVHGRRRR